MRSFDDWNDDLVDDGRQPDLPFDGSAPAASAPDVSVAAPDVNDTVTTPVVRPPLEELFDALVRAQQEEDAAPLPPPAVVETEVVSMPVALVLKPREPLALAPIQVPPSLEAPIAFEPIQVAPVHAEPVQVEPVQFEPVRVEPVVREAAHVASEAAPVVSDPVPVVSKMVSFEPLMSVPAPVAPEIPKVVVPELVAPDQSVLANAIEVKPVVAEPVAPKFVEPIAPKPIGIKPIAVKPVVETPKVEAAVPEPEPMPTPDVAPEGVVAAAPAKAARSGRMGRLFAAAAAIVIIVGAIGIPMGRLWATRQSEVAVVAPQPQPRATTPAAAPAREKRVEPVAAATPEVTTVSAPIVENVVAASPVVSGSTSALAKPKTPPATTTAARPPVRVQTPGVAPSASAVLTVTAAAEAIPVSSAPIVPPPAPEPVATPAAEAPQPIGPFFEMMQVDKAPRIATRVEPQWPTNAGPKVNDIALVRVLVSQAGHPVLVRMLRPSKGGIAYDDAVIAAVKQWTFTPAVKKGDAVTCWLHVAVPLKSGK